MVTKTLRDLAKTKGVKIEEKKKGKPIWKAYLENQFLMLCTAVLFLLVSAYGFYGWTMQVGVNQGYMPIQPIHYSHKIHSGDNKIDCNYCHSSAKVSKHSGIPSLNICMNCHKSIYEYNGETSEEYSKEFYDNEIQKLYKAVGWDDEAQEYTGGTYPVKWVRIHNLPDFAYFNHAQHVSVAGIECQTCHGPVEEMEIIDSQCIKIIGILEISSQEIKEELIGKLACYESNTISAELFDKKNRELGNIAFTDSQAKVNISTKTIPDKRVQLLTDYISFTIDF